MATIPLTTAGDIVELDAYPQESGIWSCRPGLVVNVLESGSLTICPITSNAGNDYGVERLAIGRAPAPAYPNGPWLSCPAGALVEPSYVNFGAGIELWRNTRAARGNGRNWFNPRLHDPVTRLPHRIDTELIPVVKKFYCQYRCPTSGHDKVEWRDGAWTYRTRRGRVTITPTPMSMPFLFPQPLGGGSVTSSTTRGGGGGPSTVTRSTTGRGRNRFRLMLKKVVPRIHTSPPPLDDGAMASGPEMKDVHPHFVAHELTDIEYEEMLMESYYGP